MLAQPQAIARPRGARCLPGPESGLKRFPFNNFTYFLTLFSKCFSSFDHSTCALSVSRRYLALDETYHPLGAAFPNNSTRRRPFTREEGAGLARDSHPLRRPVPRNMGRRSPPKMPLQITTRRSRTPDFKFELLPLHSPLLGQSLLVSFPPLIDMLKFSGYPYLIRGVPMSRSPRPTQGPGAGCPAALERQCVISRSGTQQAVRPWIPARWPPARGTPPPPSPRVQSREQSSRRRSNRHAPRNARGRNVRSKIR
jgi:hypothetical protein